MDISKIERRLSNGYYRSLQSIHHDNHLILSNAFKFNNPDSLICVSSVKVTKLLTFIIDNFQDVEQCLLMIIKNKKSLKQALSFYFPSHVVKNQDEIHTFQPNKQTTAIPIIAFNPNVSNVHSFSNLVETT